MISLNSGVPLVNTDTLIENFASNGRNTDLLEMCNFQDFKYIDGCGEGYFLIKYGAISNSATTCVLNLTQGGTTINRILNILDSYTLENSTSPVLQIIRTAEAKYNLESVTATRNYNVVNIKTISGSTSATLAPDTTAKNIVQIINDIMPTALVVFDGTPFKPFNMFIDGLSLREVIDRVCQAYGMLWTVEYSVGGTEEEPTTVLTIYIYRGTSLVNNTALPNDMNIPYPIRYYKDITTIYSIIDNGLQVPRNTVQKSTTSSGQRSYEMYIPYTPALLTPGTNTVANDTGLTNVHTYAAANMASIINFENYYKVLNYIDNSLLPSIPPRALKYSYGHNGTGLRTHLYSGMFPTLKVPEHNRSDRQATHVVGHIKYEYKGAISGFYVVAEYGLDGYIANNTDLYVTNLYNWNYGAADAKIRIEWDAINRRWIPLQQAYICPPSEDPDPMPDPPEDPVWEDIGFGV